MEPETFGPFTVFRRTTDSWFYVKGPGLLPDGICFGDYHRARENAERFRDVYAAVAEASAAAAAPAPAPDPSAPAGPDWKQIHANESEKAIEHEIVTNIVDELMLNLSNNFKVPKDHPFVRRNAFKIANAAAQVARAQALGFPPEALLLTPDESSAAILRQAEAAVRAGRPVAVIALSKAGES